MYFTNFSELMDELETANNGSRAYFQVWQRHLYLTIIPRARMGSESIAHEAEGRMGY